MTNYARDEFDRVPEASSRQGVHRAVSAPSRAPGSGPILTVGIGALAVGLVAFLLLPQLGFDAAASPLVSHDAPKRRPAGSPARSPARAPAPPPRRPPARRHPQPHRPARRRPPLPRRPPAQIRQPSKRSPPPWTSRSRCPVYNGTLTSGLAGRVGATVQADGWTLGQVANWQGAPQQASVIFYSGASAKANAEALGAAAEHHHTGGERRIRRPPLPWCWAPDSSDSSGLRLNNY